MIPTDPPEVSGIQWAGITGRSAFDVGAHLGENIPFLLAAGCEKITAFEPFPDLYDRLAAQWWPKVDCCPLAAWDRDGTLELAENDGMLGALMGSVKHQVGCTTLDSEAASRGYPDVVVVDVEGGEEKVLEGARRIIDVVHPSWLVEFHTEQLYWNCRGILEGYGYAVETVRHPHYLPDSSLWRGHGWIKALRPAVLPGMDQRLNPHVHVFKKRHCNSPSCPWYVCECGEKRKALLPLTRAVAGLADPAVLLAAPVAVPALLVALEPQPAALAGLAWLLRLVFPGHLDSAQIA